jgi:hypothetical protein
MKLKMLTLAGIASLLLACNPQRYDAQSFIEMKKEPCFGLCPVYTIKIDGSGQAVFSGERNVKKIGNFKKTLTPDEVSALFMAFENGKFQDFKEEYTDQVSDQPTTYLTFQHGGNRKTVKDYFGAPTELKELEKLVELIAESEDGWVQQ